MRDELRFEHIEDGSFEMRYCLVDCVTFTTILSLRQLQSIHALVDEAIEQYEDELFDTTGTRSHVIKSKAIDDNDE